MASQIQLENFYQTVLTSPTIAATGDVSFTVATPPTYPKGWIVLSSENASKREVMYYHSVIGNTISVRGVNRVNPKEHTQNEIVRINDVAEVFNFITGQISTAFYVEKTGGLNITVWGGSVNYNGAVQSFNDANLTLTNNATNYVKYDYPSNTISVDTVNSGNIKATVVVASGVITSISYLTPKESFIDFTASLTGALPSQAGHAGEALVTDGTNVSWYGGFLQKVGQLRTGLSNWKIFTTNGSGAEGYVDVGATDTILTSNGTAAAPTFKSLPYANQAEAEAGTDNVKLMTPLRVAQYVPVASETVAGKVERATDAEAAAGTDTTRYINSLQLSKAGMKGCKIVTLSTPLSSTFSVAHGLSSAPKVVKVVVYMSSLSSLQSEGTYDNGTYNSVYRLYTSANPPQDAGVGISTTSISRLTYDNTGSGDDRQYIMTISSIDATNINFSMSSISNGTGFNLYVIVYY